MLTIVFSLIVFGRREKASVHSCFLRLTLLTSQLYCEIRLDSRAKMSETLLLMPAIWFERLFCTL